MADFIKVTDARALEHLINQDSIREIIRDEKPDPGMEGCYIHMVDGSILYVEDNIEEIEQMLNAGKK